MNEPRTAALTLWNRLISGETLNEVDRQRLADLLQQDSALRDEFQADATLNALLRFMTDVRQTDDQFVQAVLDQCSAMPPRALPNVEVNQIERQLGGLSDKTDPLHGVLESVPLNGARITVATNHRRKHERAYSRRRQRSTWTAFTLTAAIFACLSLFVWFLADTPFPTARTNPNERVVRGPDTATASVSENNRTNAPRSIASGDNHPDRQIDSIDLLNSLARSSFA